MRFGFHIPRGGGFSRVVERALVRGCETIQLFSRNPRGWKCSPLDLDDVESFKVNVRGAGISPLFIHLPYLPNLATPEPSLRARSVQAVCEDLQRAELLGAQFLIVHVGSRKAISEEEAVENVAEAVNRALAVVENPVRLLLENTAGMGSEIGSQFGEIGAILRGIRCSARVGVCFDTAHAYEAGYDISTAQGLEITLEEVDRFFGLTRVCAMHLNDSKTALGSRVDRHWHIGDGFIGREGFRRIINHPRLRDLPAIMETPRGETEDDLKNMRAVRSLVTE